MLWQIFKTFFLIGAFTFGGGVAMIPIIEKEVVEKNGWITEEEFLDMLAIVQSAPGVMAANMSTYIGYQLKGFIGAVVGCLAVILPSFLIITIIAMFFFGFINHPMANNIFMGIRPAVAALIASAVFNLLSKTEMNIIKILAIIAVALLVGLMGLNPIIFLILGGVISTVYDKMESNNEVKKDKRDDKK